MQARSQGTKLQAGTGRQLAQTAQPLTPSHLTGLPLQPRRQPEAEAAPTPTPTPPTAAAAAIEAARRAPALTGARRDGNGRSPQEGARMTRRPLTGPSGLPPARPPAARRPRVPSGRPLPRSCPSSCGPSPSCRTRPGAADSEVPLGGEEGPSAREGRRKEQGRAGAGGGGGPRYGQPRPRRALRPPPLLLPYWDPTVKGPGHVTLPRVTPPTVRAA